MKILLADNQDITRAGLMYICSSIQGAEIKYTEDRGELIEALKQAPDSVIIMDYTLFDINDAAELLILNERFPDAQWLLFFLLSVSDFLVLLNPELCSALTSEPEHPFLDSPSPALLGPVRIHL